MSMIDRLADEHHVEFGVWTAGVVVTLLWNINWRHWIRYWVRTQPPPTIARITFRIFFAVSFVGTLWAMIDMLLKEPFSLVEYGFGLIDAAILLLFIGAINVLAHWRLGPIKQ